MSEMSVLISGSNGIISLENIDGITIIVNLL